jgi:uncharacterized hydrophobic protein (TIGR00271 family)
VLHLRVTCPPDTTEAVLGRLRRERGAAHVTVIRGAVVKPPGDLIEAEVAREAADELLADLRALDLERTGGITLSSPDTVLSDTADAAVQAAPGEPADALVWDELIERTGSDTQLTFTFLGLLALACLIAVVGVVTDSPVTVVGAMVVGPEFGPLAALAVGLALRRADLIRGAALALGVGFPVAMLIATAGVLLTEWTGLIGTEVIRSAKQVDFIYQVGPFSLILALLAGAAGMLSLTSAKSAALIGVFISVTTVPAAAFAVIAITMGAWRTAGESVLQLLVNLVGITVAGVIVLALRHRRGGKLGHSPTRR